ncbi:MAG: polysaccharide deacetylase family protein [Acidobacteriia bacterium]|nr:polysaccharide deacetylase family protein [Terriglobia bacterium]
MFNRYRPMMLLCCAALLCGHSNSQDPAKRAASPDLQAVGPNELGKIMILEYHLIQPEETRWGRSISNFKQDLERLYESGYRPIGMAEYIDGKIATARGRRPVILTFDDSSEGQFRYLIRNGKPEIDPDCAVGMLMDFRKLHPDFALKAIFFVLPGAQEPHKLFGQPEFEAQKLRELAALGFEIGNHTLWHADLAKYDATVVQEQIARAAQAIQKMVPGYNMRALALPLGNYPRDPNLAIAGSYRGTSYRLDAVLLVSGGPAPSPFSVKRDLTRLPRIQVTGTELQRWIAYFQKHPTEGFTSDGEADAVTFPRELRPEFNSTKFNHLRVIADRPESHPAKTMRRFPSSRAGQGGKRVIIRSEIVLR